MADTQTEVIEAARAFLNVISNTTTDDFANGGDSVTREKLRAALEAHDAELALSDAQRPPVELARWRRAAFTLADIEGGNPDVVTRCQVYHGAYGVWLTMDDAEGNPLCMVHLDYFRNKAQALVYNWRATALDAEPSSRIPLLSDVRLALATTHEHREAQAELADSGDELMAAAPEVK